jgi:hypothetical protein
LHSHDILIRDIIKNFVGDDSKLQQLVSLSCDKTQVALSFHVHHGTEDDHAAVLKAIAALFQKARHNWNVCKHHGIGVAGADVDVPESVS